MDIAGIKASTDELTQKTVPAILAGVAADVKLATDALTGVSDNLTKTIIPAVANGISMVLRQVQALDGATVTVGPITIPAITITLRIPLKPVE